MKKIAKFEKVSFDQFKKDMEKTFNVHYKNEYLMQIYNDIELPKRSTSGSAGYDFKSPLTICIEKGKPIVIPTGIRVKMDVGWVLNLYPRSGMGFKYGLRLCNTVGIIDSDYYDSDNEGHIMAKIEYCHGDSTLEIKRGVGFMQGIFTEYGITEDDNVDNIRNGGFGSTDK